MKLSHKRLAIIIPARFGSTRLPGKPLAELNGKPMIQHVYERALEVPGVYAVAIATDDQRVVDAVNAFAGRCIMTSRDHLSGTDRLAEVALQIEAEIYINLQGDEPLVRPGDIELLAQGMFADHTVEVGTLVHEIHASEAITPHTVKVVLANNSDVLYFSRSPIPYPLEETKARYFKHVGVYAYRRNVLATFAVLPQPMLEEAEKLEQLRLLAAGFRIRAFKVEPTEPGVDTLECLERVRAIMNNKSTHIQQALSNIKLVITDVDGVLTDGGIYYDGTGECIKRFHARDGLGIRMLEENGIRVAVLSGRDSETLRKRMADLGVTLHQFGVKDKATACRQLMASAGVDKNETAFIGDDSIDLPAFECCGLSYTVANAPDYVKQQACSVLKHPGGEGAFRELADAILEAQGKAHVYKSAQGFVNMMEGSAQ